jgi:hypothetical protein
MQPVPRHVTLVHDIHLDPCEWLAPSEKKKQPRSLTLILAVVYPRGLGYRGVCLVLGGRGTPWWVATSHGGYRFLRSQDGRDRHTKEKGRNGRKLVPE